MENKVMIIWILFMFCGVAFADDVTDKTHAFFYNTEYVGDIVIQNGKSFVQKDLVDKYLGETETFEIFKIDDQSYIWTRALADSLECDIFWNRATSSAEMFTKFTDYERRTISHGGGFLDGYVTSMKEALDNSIKSGVRLIETDIIWSSDNHPVLSHDWWIVSSYAKVPVEGPVTMEEFKKIEFTHGWTPLSFYDLNEWMRENRSAFIVTDVKDRNIDVLKMIVDSYPEHMNRFIPQVYSFDEYRIAQEMGYNRVILTLYRMALDPTTIYKEIMELNHHNLYAVAMPPERAESGLSEDLNEKGIFVYVHTINDYPTREFLHNIGAGGFYTDVFDVELP